MGLEAGDGMKIQNTRGIIFHHIWIMDNYKFMSIFYFYNWGFYGLVTETGFPVKIVIFKGF